MQSCTIGIPESRVALARHMVRRTAHCFRKNVRIELLDVSKEHLRQALMILRKSFKVVYIAIHTFRVRYAGWRTCSLINIQL